MANNLQRHFSCAQNDIAITSRLPQSSRQSLTRRDGNKKNKKVFVRIGIKYLILILCCFGCFINLWSVFSMYLAYPTTVTVEAEMVKRLELPAVTICGLTEQLEKPTNFKISDRSKEVS